jgi:hypothetical protein
MIAHPLSLQGPQILAIARPEGLFPGDPEQAKKLHRELAKRWHPDVNPGMPVQEVIAHINELYRVTLDKLTSEQWEGPMTLELQTKSGPLVIQTLASSTFPLGQTVVCAEALYYLISATHQEYFAQAVKVPSHFMYAGDAMRKEFSRYLPNITRTTTLKDGRLLLQVAKTRDLIRLRDILTNVGPLDPKHVAWMVSSLLNLACYFSYAGIVHHDISPDTYFISPEFHSGALLGGWWYVRHSGDPVKVVPKRTYDAMPFTAKTHKVASTWTDLELIRVTARESLAHDGPKPMMAWLHKTNTRSAREQYEEWTGVLKESFGPRRFVKWDLTNDQVYGR